MNTFAKTIQYALEGIFFILIYSLGRILPLNWGRALIGGLAQLLGPLLPAQKIGLKNLSIAFPHMSIAQQKSTLKHMWWHFGSVCIEYTKTYKFQNILKNIPPQNIQGVERLCQTLKAYPTCIFVSAHLGNWALASALLSRYTPDLIMIHRAPNNPIINWMFHYIQNAFATTVVEKNRNSGINLYKHLQNHKSIIMLMDQKNNMGLNARLFGHPAMTSPSAAKLSHVLQIPIIPFYALRKPNNQWQIVVDKPIQPVKEDPQILATTQRLNDLFESWIRKNPEQWFWIHKRFEKNIYKNH